MSLTPNPLAKLVTQVSASLESGATKVAAFVSGNTQSKAKLDNLVNERSGAVGSSLNWAGTEKAGGGFTNGGYGSVGNVAKAAQTTVAGGASTLQRAAAGVSNAFGDLNRAASSLNKLTGGNIAGSIQNFAAGVSGFAGQLNNLLSGVRAAGIPNGAETLAQQGSATELQPSPSNDWRVKIRLNNYNSYSDVFGSGNPLMAMVADNGGISWPYTPTVTLSTKANYTTVDPTHSNYPFYAYKNSRVDDIQISGEFSVETQFDAAYWIAATTFFRSVTKMFFGSGENAGNPPPICILDGYGSSVFKSIPVIVTSFSVDFKDDTNYIYYEPTQTWVPILSTVSVTVVPIYNRARLRQFSLQDFSKGGYIISDGIGGL